FLIFAPTPSSAQFEIKEWPHNLRTDLKNSKIKIALPKNEPDHPWNDALLARFRKLTRIEVETIRPSNDTTVILATYLRDFASSAPRTDVYAIDIVWPGILANYAEDLHPEFSSLSNMIPMLVQNNSVNSRLV